ncbi:MAG: hypothetical protein M3O30_12690 [Planctomycetota bacterium]|nr:hypothetical protein [Planctomycetota bacterium]
MSEGLEFARQIVNIHTMKMKTIARLGALSILGVCVFTAGDFADAADATTSGSAASRPAAADADVPQPGTGALANYTILKTTDYGKSLVRNFSAQTTARQVVKATVPDLIAIFGQKPKLVGVYQDQKDKKSACVFFSESLSGQPVKGISVIKVTDDVTREWVVFCQANAPRGEAMKLLALHKPSQPAVATSAGSTGAGGGAAAAGSAPANPPANDSSGAPTVPTASSDASNPQSIPPADIKLQTYNFPDGTGSVGVPDGWTCTSPTIGNSIVKGPADQTVGLDLSAVVDVPRGQSIRLLQMAHGDLSTALIGPFNPDPASALKNLIEALNRISRAHGGPTNTVDEIVDQKPVPAGSAVPNARAAIIEMKSTRTTNGVAKKFHSVQRFNVYSLNGGQDTWSYFATQMNAPEETFKQDFPVMNAIVASLAENAGAINAKGAAELRQANQIVAQTNRMVAASDANVARMQQQQLESDRSFADVDEGIRGYRKVYDMQTGEESDVNLGDVNGVVNALNEADPGRYVQVPLRDEVQP